MTALDTFLNSLSPTQQNQLNTMASQFGGDKLAAAKFMGWTASPAGQAALQERTSPITTTGLQAGGTFNPPPTTTVPPSTTPTTTTPPAATSPTSPASTGTKPYGIENITKTLTFGSQGTDVKELQNYLAGLGAVGADGKPLKADGIYGSNTKAAVMKFQQDHGLTADGVFGPKSLSTLQNVAGTTTQYQTGSNTPTTPTGTGTTTPPTGTSGTAPAVTGNPDYDALLKTLGDWIKSQQDAGLKINPALNFNQATLDKFLETAKTQVHPYYAQQIDAVKAGVLHDAPQILQNYESNVAGKQSNFQNDLGTARENYAGGGLAFSGQRAKGEYGMQDAQNRDLSSLNQTYGNQLYNLGTNAEAKIGSTNAMGFNLPSLNNYSANLSGNGGFNSNGSSAAYTPGNQTGSLNYDEQQAIEARNQALKSAASADVVNGRSYQDLFA